MVFVYFGDCWDYIVVDVGNCLLVFLLVGEVIIVMFWWGVWVKILVNGLTRILLLLVLVLLVLILALPFFNILALLLLFLYSEFTISILPLFLLQLLSVLLY